MMEIVPNMTGPHPDAPIVVKMMQTPAAAQVSIVSKTRKKHFSNICLTDNCAEPKYTSNSSIN